MRLVMTVMVRDEADVIASMLEHHLEQGIDQFVITDNGSVDGTAEILEDYAARGVVDLRHDPVHRKQQGVTVTGMARDAATLHGADWVINADADEFWVAADRHRTLHEAFADFDPTWRAFTVPVTDMTGAPALKGTGLSRLRYRDQRPVESLHSVGLFAHATADAVHVADPDITVVQGNHFVNIESLGSPPEGAGIEVLHLPWRSWEQFSRKVENAGRAYDRSPELTPSANHHGMRDWRRMQLGTLFAWYLIRHPDEAALRAGIDAGWYVEDTTLVGRTDAVPDVVVADDDPHRLGALVDGLVLTDSELLRVSRDASALRSEVESLRFEIAEANQTLAHFRARRIVRLLDRSAALLRR